MDITTGSGTIRGFICTAVAFDSISVRMLIDIAALSNSSRHQVFNVDSVCLQDRSSLAQSIMSCQCFLLYSYYCFVGYNSLELMESRSTSVY